LVLISASAYGQSGYKLEFKVKGLKDTTAYLGYYSGEQTYVRDTAKVNSNGVFTFEDPRPVAQGVFMVLLNRTPVLQFILGSDQRLMIETDTDDYTAHASVTGDEDNKLFFENANYLASKYKEAEPFIKVIRDSSLREDQKKQAREEFKKFGQEVQSYQNDLVTKHPTTFTARLIKSTKEVEVPEPPKRADGTIDSTWQFRYYRDHYWDNFDLADDALIHLPKPMYKDKVRDYLDRLFIQVPDTLTKEIFRLAAKTKKNQEAYKYFVWTCLTHYQTHKIMGLDEVYVNLYDKFIATGEMDFWLDKKAKQSIKEYVDKVRLSLVNGNAPNLIMQDKDLKPKSMYDIKNKYTILYFFNPDCGHCKEETPKLVEFYNKQKSKFDLEVYAVSTDTSMAKMRTFIKDFKMPWTTVNGPRTYVGHWSKLYYAETTPTMYVIDAKHKIIAKKLPVEQLSEFFEKYDLSHRPKPNEIGERKKL
jgi:peroxiredoxin